MNRKAQKEYYAQVIIDLKHYKEHSILPKWCLEVIQKMSESSDLVFNDNTMWATELNMIKDFEESMRKELDKSS